MKKVTIVAVGKVKESFIRDGIAEYAKRLSRFCDFSVCETSESKREDRAEEAQAILKETGTDFVIAADLSGENVSSERLAEIMEDFRQSHDRICFVIGGSRGLDKNVLKRADKIISFGKATYPHMLFRLMLTEQIYRAFTINAGLPYHK